MDISWRWKMIIKTDEFTTDRFDNDNTWSAVCEVTVKIKKVYQEGNEIENIDELPKGMHDFIKRSAIEKYIDIREEDEDE